MASGQALQTMDPRTLLLTAAGTAFCFSAILSITISCAGLMLAAIFALRWTPSWQLLLQRLFVANFFILFVWLTVPLTMPGINILTLGPLAFSLEGITLAVHITLKCNAILLIYISTIADMDLPTLGYAMERLHCPVKLVFIFLFTYRYIYDISNEWKKLQTAAKLRGFSPNTSLHTYRTIGNMFGLTIINSINKSHKVYEAMLLRGFNGHFHTTAELKMHNHDIFFILSFFTVLLILLCADLYIIYCHD